MHLFVISISGLEASSEIATQSYQFFLWGTKYKGNQHNSDAPILIEQISSESDQK